MRILCLHGRRQSGVTLANKMFDNKVCQKVQGNKQLAIDIGGHEFIFVDGPYVAKADLPKGAKPRDVACEMYSWWSDEHDDGSKALEVVDQARSVNGPFDCILGFSQGGALAASLCRSNTSWQPQLAVFLSSYYFEHFPLPRLIKPNISDTPLEALQSLHVWGEKDQVVIPAKSRQLCEWMKGDCIPFVGGHAVPPIPWAESTLLPWLSSKNIVRRLEVQ